MQEAAAGRVVSDSVVNVVLADPPNPPNNPYVSAFPNLAAMYLSAAVKARFPQARVTYLDHRLSWEDHLRRLGELKPDIYGLSYASPFARIARKFLKDVRAVVPRTFVVCGGAHPTIAAAEILAATPADCCCIGEGEVTFPELIEAVLNEDDLAQVAGIAYRDGDGKMVVTEKRGAVRQLDDLPWPDYQLTDLKSYSGLRMALNQPSTAMVAGRGCPWNCAFCSNPVWRHHSPRVRLHSPERVAAEAEELYRLGMREIYIRSDEINVDLAWAIEVFEGLAALGHADLSFQCNVRAKPMSDELAAAMKKANCWECHIGLESASDRVLNGIQKGIVREDFQRCTRILRRAGIKVYAFMMMYNIWEDDGVLQVETSREVAESIGFIVHCRARGLVDRMSWGFATPYPGSEMQRLCDKYHLQLPPADPDGIVGPDQISTRLPGVQARDMVAVRVGGLLAQSALAVSTRQFWSGRNPAQTMRHAAYKVGRLAGISGR